MVTLSGIVTVAAVVMMFTTLSWPSKDSNSSVVRPSSHTTLGRFSSQPSGLIFAEFHSPSLLNASYTSLDGA